MKHLRTIPHTGTRATSQRAKAEGHPYTSIGHLTDKQWARPITWGLPTDMTVRDPIALAISTCHHVIQSRFHLYGHLYEQRDSPHVTLIKLEDTPRADDDPSATPDYLGLRERYILGGEAFPEALLEKIPRSARAWLREQFGYEV